MHPSPSASRLVLPLLALGLVLGCRPGGQIDVVETIEVSGTVTYRERIRMPDDARLEIAIQDRGGEAIADTAFVVGAQVPITFSIDIPQARIDTSRAYALSARISAADGRIVWSTPSPLLVLTRGAPTEVEVVLTPERRPEPATTDPWRQARERGVGFRAIGQEPGWMLDVYGHFLTPRRIVLRTNYDENTYQFEQVIRDEDGDGNLRYRASAADVRIEAVIEDKLCHDIMSGEEFDAEVKVRVNDELLTGCGRALD
jgi:uncharacterized lipoprotein YbaY